MVLTLVVRSASVVNVTWADGRGLVGIDTAQLVKKIRYRVSDTITSDNT